MSTPLGLSPRLHPALMPSDLSLSRHPEPSGPGTTEISSPLWDQHTARTPSDYPRPNRHLGSTRSKKASDKYQAQPRLKQELPALPSSRRYDTQVARLKPSSIPPTPGRLFDGGRLDPRLAAITHRDSKLSQSREFHPKVFSFDSEFRS